MNREALARVADAIEQGSADLAFDMRIEHGWRQPDGIKYDSLVFRHKPLLDNQTCEAVACGVGWTNKVFGEAPIDWRSRETAQAHLGLTEEEAFALFYPADGYEPTFLFLGHQSVKAVHMIKVLRYAARTGRIDWRAAMTEKQLAELGENLPPS